MNQIYFFFCSLVKALKSIDFPLDNILAFVKKNVSVLLRLYFYVISFNLTLCIYYFIYQFKQTCFYNIRKFLFLCNFIISYILIIEKGMADVRQQRIYCAEQIVVPDQLPNILKHYSKAVIKQNPANIVSFSAKYFKDLLDQQRSQARDHIQKPDSHH